MLKALELVGFKSFADKTHFEFRPGITVVVGPNGSGKSNVVDAIKWVLGEQSVKALRGKEMADVIFKGSGGDTRRPLHSAEVTLTLDNADGLLSVDSPEVHVTRRIYRSGEGEYLINRSACRLRDIRDMFAGTGVATEAYSVIEQGKVDALLKASARERRVIFEEAAGISRFKAKKVEALRRMERVEQNLLRLSDIVEEVDNRLRSVKSQATKARRYREYTERLQQLRTSVGMADWTSLTDKIEQLDEQVQALREEAGGLAAEAEKAEAAALEVETNVAAVEVEVRAAEARMAKNRERIAACEAAIFHERRRAADLENELQQGRQHAAALSVRAGDLKQQVKDSEAEVTAVQQEYRTLSGEVAEQERGVTVLTQQLDELRQQSQQFRGEHIESMRQAAELGKRISGLETQLTGANAMRDDRLARIGRFEASRDKLQIELDSLRRQLQQSGGHVEDLADELEGAASVVKERQRQQANRQDQLAQLQRRHTAASERAAVLDELEKRLEGVGAGVREVLVAAQNAVSPPYNLVRGLVADCLRVSVETAPLVEAALGERTQHVVVGEGGPLFDHLNQHASELAGRVGFVALDRASGSAHRPPVNLSGQSGVVGRADSFVDTEPEFRGLAEHLLGQTWIVQTLADAIRLAAGVGRSARFVTLRGDLLEEDGTLVAGPRNSAAGLISRRSELRVLVEQVVQLDEKIATQQQAVALQAVRIDQDQLRVHDLTLEHRSAVEQHNANQVRLVTIEEQLEQLDEEQSTVQRELQAAELDVEDAAVQLNRSRVDLHDREIAIARSEAQLEKSTHQAKQIDAKLQKEGQQAGTARVQLAKVEQRLSHLQVRMRQFEKDAEERRRAIDDSRGRLTNCAERIQQSARATLSAQSEAAELYLHKELLGREISDLTQQRDEIRRQRGQFAQQSQQARAKLRRVDEQIHERELKLGEIQHERGTLADRMREDYDIDLAKAAEQPIDEDEMQQREEVEVEISDLRRKLNNLGGVNVDALEELDEMETRYASLSSQHQDLTSAKDSLQQIINRINGDSRRLFAETLDAVRENFEKLFRRAFGGGTAQIVLDEDVDILEAGIEIVATPPGKQELNTSLLSGGERALTAVTLLLAIFKYRPSPFCVLDEVDAPLDEANIDRFIRLLKEFPSSTQFIVISHSKKTMTAADTIYGVTMQESGVSKRVSVRFDGEQVSAKGTTASPDGDDETQAA